MKELILLHLHSEGGYASFLQKAGNHGSDLLLISRRGNLNVQRPGNAVRTEEPEVSIRVTKDTVQHAKLCGIEGVNVKTGTFPDDFAVEGIKFK